MINPLIFYRVRRPAKDISKLPVILLTKLYEQSKAESEQVVFTCKKVQTSGLRGKNYKSYIEDQDSLKVFDDLYSFTPGDDRQLMKCIDNYIKTELGDKNIGDVQASDFDFKKFDLKNSKLKKLSTELLLMRSSLFLKFTKQFIKAIDQLDISSKPKPGSISHFLFKCKSLALNSAKNVAMNTMIEKSAKFFNGSCPEIYMNRNRASVFADDNKVDHDGTATIFGQCFQQCKAHDSSYSNFRQDAGGTRCWCACFIGEGAEDGGGPFRDSLDNIAKELESDVLPLLIKTSNNRNNHGDNRDCFMLNPSSRSPTHLEMFKFLGAFLAFAIMSGSPLPIHLAPSIWKQLLGEELEISDLESFDAYSSRVLIDLRDHSSQLTEEEFAKSVKLNFTTILSNGEETSLKPGEAI